MIALKVGVSSVKQFNLQNKNKVEMVCPQADEI